LDASASLQQEKHSRFELRTLLETSRLLAESHDMDFVLNNLLLITMGKLMVSRGLILLYEPAKKSYTVSKSKGKSCLPEGETVIFDDLESAHEYSVIRCGTDELQIPELIEGDDSCTLFNLRTRSNHIGFLCLGSKGDHSALKQHEIDFVESLSIISSVAIANSRMFSELKQTNRRLDRKIYELNTLLDLSKDFNRMVDRDEIARVFKFAMLGQMLIRKFFFVLQQDGQRSVIATNSIQGSPAKKQMDRLFSLQDDVITVDRDLRNRISFLVENDIHALISLYFQNEKMAVVGIGAKANGEPYTESDFNFLQSLGNLALLSIQKTLLLEERIEKERLEEELNIARSIQQGMLPNPIPSHPKLDIAARNVPSQQVGGDYFDILETPGGNLLFAIADVTGKGTPAALLMANLQAMLHVLLPVEIDLKKATARINDMIYQNTPSDKFVTFFWGLFDPKSMQFRYVNAGHNMPLLFRKGESAYSELTEGGLILGAMPTMNPYQEDTLKLESGDLLVCYTDGVTEAMNENQNEEYEEERLIECIRRNRKKSSQGIMQAVIDDVNAFAENIQYDDITLIVIKVK
jgi:sigma-B regulation protein RsbU (phosphoserine phosphatase)